MQKKISLFLKICLIACVSIGLTLCFINAKYDGYSHWSKRLLFFTNQSNLWILITMILLICPTSEKNKQSIRVARFVFTTSITITGLVFCCLLAPFADQSYHVWSTSGILTHVFVPSLAIADLFVDQHRIFVTKKEILFCLIPMFCYFIMTTFLFCIGVDFGRGENFPYFFFNFTSPAGIFGFSNQSPYYIGSFYWSVFIILIDLIIAITYARINNFLFNKAKNKE